LTDIQTETTSGGAGASSGAGTSLRPQNAGSQLQTDHGTTSIADSVVAKIAGVATREISGVHAMGGGAARAIGAIKERIGSQPAVTQGVNVEVGQLQAAVDLDVIVDYGVSIPDLAEAIRRNVSQRVTTMTGLEVTEVNVSIDDVNLGEGDVSDGDQSESRVE
jgi:uncharacterized alkaline shock family protein YloU